MMSTRLSYVLPVFLVALLAISSVVGAGTIPVFDVMSNELSNGNIEFIIGVDPNDGGAGSIAYDLEFLDDTSGGFVQVGCCGGFLDPTTSHEAQEQASGDASYDPSTDSYLFFDADGSTSPMRQTNPSNFPQNTSGVEFAGAGGYISAGSGGGSSVTGRIDVAHLVVTPQGGSAQITMNGVVARAGQSYNYDGTVFMHGSVADPTFRQALEDGGYTDLLAAADAVNPNLIDNLEVDGPFTVLAPTNAAIQEALGFGLEVTEETILHHVVPGDFDAATLQQMADNGDTLTALSGRPVNLASGSVVITNAYLEGGSTTNGDVFDVANGHAHGVDTVIPEPASGLIALLAGLAMMAGYRRR